MIDYDFVLLFRLTAFYVTPFFYFLFYMPKKNSNTELHKVMRSLVNRYGREILDDEKRTLNNMLSDELGSEYYQFRSSITLAQTMGVGKQMLAGVQRKDDPSILLNRVKQSFAAGSVLERPLSDYIVESYAYALGYVQSVKKLSLEETSARLTETITILENEVQSTQRAADRTLYQSHVVLRRANRVRKLAAFTFIACFILLTLIIYFLVQDNGRIPKSSELKVKKLLSACAVGDAQYVAELLHSGAYVNSRDSLGNTPMHYAVRLGSTELLDTLKSFNPDVTLVNNEGASPLDIAVESNNVSYVETVLRSITHKWIQDNYERLNKRAASLQMRETLKDAYTKIDQMKLAIQNSDVKLFERCLLYRDNQDLLYKEDGKTWLHLAAKTSDVQMLKAIVLKGVSPDVRDNHDRLAEDYASNRENRKFLNHYRLKDKLIFNAVKRNDRSFFNELLEYGANVNGVDDEGTPLVHYTVMYNYPMLSELQKKGADIHAKNRHGETLLFAAVYKNNLAIAKDLLKQGFSVQDKNADGLTPMTVKKNRTSKYLMDITYKDDFFVSSVKKNRLDSALYYLSLGAKIDYIVPDTKKAAIHYAVDNDSEKALKFLMAHGANLLLPYQNKTPVEIALFEKKRKSFVFFLRNDKTMSRRTFMNGKTLMHEAANMFASAGTDWMTTLLANGASVDALDSDQKTPLYYAICRNDVKLVNYLISKKANVSRIDSEGNQPLHNAARCALGEIIKVLVDAGADPSAENSEGDTPVDVAKKSNNMSAKDELDNYSWFGSTKKKIKKVGSDVWAKVKSLAN